MIMKDYTAVIQAGGKGSRMMELTQDKFPKPLLPLNGKPMIQWQIETLSDFGITEIVIIIGHLGDKIKDFFADGSNYGVHISYIDEKEPLGSAGALYYLKEQILSENFILIFGDVMFKIDWNRMIGFHENHQKQVTLLAHPNSHPYDSDLLLLNQKMQVTAILPKNEERSYWYENCVNAGIYILKSDILQDFEEIQKKDFEKDVLCERIKKGEVYAYITSEYVKDAGTPERFRIVCQEQADGIWAKKWLVNKQKCIFLDRDGTINQFRGLIANEDEFELEEFASEAVRKINSSGYLAIVVTNQPVVARGMCQEEDVRKIHRKMQTLLGRQGAYLDDIIFCPHHPDKGYPEENKAYKCTCECRKPATGMIRQMAVKHNLDLEKSWMIGDSTVDIKTAKNVGISSVLVMTGQAGQDGKYNEKATVIAENLLKAVEMILSLDKE